MQRQIIRFDEDLCTGCGVCAEGCPEADLQMIKGRVISEISCDVPGGCLGEGPKGAITVEEREAAPLVERATFGNPLRPTPVLYVVWHRLFLPIGVGLLLFSWPWLHIAWGRLSRKG